MWVTHGVGCAGLLFLTLPGDQARIAVNISTDPAPERLYVPFHLESSLRGSQVGQLLSLHLRKWRRYLSLPLRDLLVKPSAFCSGHHRVAVWVPPGIAPATVARLLVWHVRYHRALGFSCELAYVYREQLEAALADADIVQLVRQSQLWLVLVEGFLAAYTWGAAERASGFASNLVEPWADREAPVMYGDQIVVNAHSVLANTGQDTWLLSVDIDEYLAVDHAANVRSLFTECFGSQSAEIERVTATCSNCSTSAGGGELSLWMGASKQHPLAHYTQRYAVLEHGPVYPISAVKSLLRPDDVMSFGVHVARLRHEQQLKARVASGCGVFLLHATDLFEQRASGGGDTPVNGTSWRWVLERI